MNTDIEIKTYQTLGLRSPSWPADRSGELTLVSQLENINPEAIGKIITSDRLTVIQQLCNQPNLLNQVLDKVEVPYGIQLLTESLRMNFEEAAEVWSALQQGLFGILNDNGANWLEDLEIPNLYSGGH